MLATGVSLFVTLSLTVAAPSTSLHHSVMRHHNLLRSPLRTIANNGVLAHSGRASSTRYQNATSSKGESNGRQFKTTSEAFIPRYNGPSISEMTDEQKFIRDSIIKSRPRTGISGPFGPWIGVPEIARPASELGKACRYGTSLSFRESELVILLTGARAKSPTEFDLHTGEALLAGLTMDVISAIPRDNEFSVEKVNSDLIPLLEGNERDIAIATFTTELLETSTVSDETYAATKAALGEKDAVLVEITSIVGYYTFVAYTLNVFNIPSK